MLFKDDWFKRGLKTWHGEICNGCTWREPTESDVIDADLTSYVNCIQAQNAKMQKQIVKLSKYIGKYF